MPDGKKYTWHKLASTENEIQFQQNCIALLEWEGKKICLTRYQNKLYAFAWQCPHASGPLSEGRIDPLGNVVCPVHDYRFSLQSGRDTQGEGYKMKTWPVEEREDGIYIGKEKTSFLGF